MRDPPQENESSDWDNISSRTWKLMEWGMASLPPIILLPKQKRNVKKRSTIFEGLVREVGFLTAACCPKRVLHIPPTLSKCFINMPIFLNLCTFLYCQFFSTLTQPLGNKPKAVLLLSWNWSKPVLNLVSAFFSLDYSRLLYWSGWLEGAICHQNGYKIVISGNFWKRKKSTFFGRQKVIFNCTVFFNFFCLAAPLMCYFSIWRHP